MAASTGASPWGGPVEPSARPIHGRHLLLPAGGAAVDADLPPDEARDAAAEWLDLACRLAAPFGLGPAEARVAGGHVSLTLAAPPDLRELAVIVLDQAVGAATVQEISARPDPALRALYAAAAAAEIPIVHDAVEVVLGFGAGAVRLDRKRLPRDPATVLAGVQHIPIVRITGTNGKTTTANLLAAIATAAGETAGVATTEGVRVGPPSDGAPGTVTAAAPSAARAARMLGRDPRVTFAVLETGRGGLMRRGLLFDGADAAIVTNVSADHLGEWGIDTVEALARVKLTVAEGLRAGGALVVSADNPVLTEILAEWPGAARVRTLRFSARRQAEGWADEHTVHVAGLELPIAELPITLGGAARYNVENALAAALAARAVGLGAEAVDAGLRALKPTATDNPGRGNLYVVRGAMVIVDNVSNAEGMTRMGELAKALDGDRTTLVFGLSAPRSPELVRQLGAAAAALGCVRYVVKPIPPTQDPGPGDEVDRLCAALRDAGVGEERIAVATDEREAVRMVLDHLAPGDLALLMVHHDLRAVQRQLEAAGAIPG
ncbi:MAG: Mur ligase family protein [Myxococcota bacterium]